MDEPILPELPDDLGSLLPEIDVSPASDSAAGSDQGAVMIAAFEGWNDAGSAATSAVLHLAEVLGAQKVDELDPEEYHDFQVNRPVVSTDDDGRRVLTWPTTTVSVAELDGRRFVLVHGIEPSMRWRTYCKELLGIATTLGVRTVITVGGLLADVPHTRPIPVSATSEDPAVQALLDVEQSAYEGPTGIVGVLQHSAQEGGLRALSLWAAVPHYVAHPPSPKATLALVVKLEDLLGVHVPLGDLLDDARAWEHGVDELAEEDEEIAQYVAQLEQAKDTVELPEATGEAIAREFERYLRRRERGDQPGDPRRARPGSKDGGGHAGTPRGTLPGPATSDDDGPDEPDEPEASPGEASPPTG
ncbi:PAC2 family protein [Sanguibacter hominis ATCC BAA-789]|uniref:PAC2 family protein n=2 Tax=Sanguibacter TaxID=60919 RepID=A0A9X5FBM7_9MICO|nr:PAC2 family protein [Sanguibacter hominis ATCC BAA-789]